MPAWAMANIWWITAGCYILAVGTALLPWLNAEVLMLSAVPMASSQVELAALVLAVTAGQMTGKSIMYWLSRKTTRPQFKRLQGSIDRCRVMFQRRPWSALAVTFISSTVGFPPFYIVSIAAGALKVAFGRFLAVGTLGRLIHFAILAFLPHLIWRSL